MANTEKKLKNLAYLMLTRYKGEWDGDFGPDMGISKKDCELIWNTYADKVSNEIQKEIENGDDIPSADELINKALKKLNLIIATCDDPSKLTRSIEILSDLKKACALKVDKKETIFDKMHKELKK